MVKYNLVSIWPKWTTITTNNTPQPRKISNKSTNTTNNHQLDYKKHRRSTTWNSRRKKTTRSPTPPPKQPCKHQQTQKNVASEPKDTNKMHNRLFKKP